VLERILCLFWVSTLAAALPAGAQDTPDAAGDPPGIAGRLAYEDGSVSLQPAGVTDWNTAPLNQPLTQGDSLWSDAGARAEVDLGVARVRMDQLSSLSLVALGDRAVQLRLQAGSIDIAVSNVADLDWFEVDAPSATVSILRPGEYRLTVDNARTTSVAVRIGQAQAQGVDPRDPGSSGASIGAGQRGLFGADGAYAILQTGQPDAFDLWCQQRQARWSDEQAVAQYVSSDAVGYQDLNDYGEWQQQPDDGYVWFPTDVAADWVPYSTGRWVWMTRWGWSWVDEAPWGFAPFHYGRWRRYGGRWGWVPCPPHQRTVYAPALVAWIGGPGVPGAPGLGGGPAVGWLPLAPGEVFVPAYAASDRYLLKVNLTNSRRLNAAQVTRVAANPTLQGRYLNLDTPGALSIVPQVSFTGGQSVNRHRIGLPPTWLSAVPVARAPAIAPERASVIGGLTLSHISTPPGTVLARPVLAQRGPPEPPPAFDRQIGAVQANGGRPLDAAQLAALRTSAGNSTYRGIPERAPQNQAAVPSSGVGENVFDRREREIQIEQEQQRAQPSKPVRRATEPGFQVAAPTSRPAPPPPTPPPVLESRSAPSSPALRNPAPRGDRRVPEPTPGNSTR